MEASMLNSVPFTSVNHVSKRCLTIYPVRRVLDLAPLNWKKILENEDAQQRLAANVFRHAPLGLLDDHSPPK